MKGEVTKSLDRVSMSLSKRINAGGYNHFYDCFMSYSSDVDGSETVDQAMKRVRKQTIKEFETLLEYIEGHKEESK